nr:hypothetical protein B0A51_12037 [Rachicladosporium sp. CCFEE 5018]
MNENTRPRADGDGKSNGTAHSTAIDGKRSHEIQQDAPVKDHHISQPNGHTSPSSISAAQAKAYSHKYKHAFAIHREAHVSCLTRDYSTPVSFQGFRGLAHLVLATSILRLMIENFKKYGFRVSLAANGPSRSDTVYGTILYLTVPCHLFVAYGIEVIAARYAREAVGRVKKSEGEERDRQLDVERRALRDLWWRIAIAHAVNATCNLVVSSVVVYWYIENPGIGFIHTLHATIVWLKTISYAFTNRDLRHAFLSPPSPHPTLPPLYASLPYPSNITLPNLCYFWWAPTLIYQPLYPRTPSIRWTFILKRLAEATLAIALIYLTCAQYAVPLLDNSLPEISHLNLLNITERVLKLSTISLICWLAGFYALFQSLLNALAELMTFDDRDFYGDWWNCSDVRSYWTSWNKPVAHFMKRHIYAPLVGRGVPPPAAQILTFLFSAALHELLVGVPTHSILGLAFMGMVVQIPLIFLTDLFSRRGKGKGGEWGWRETVGNWVFWASFCLVGQPIAALGYYFAWQAKYGRPGEIERPDLGELFGGGQKS